MEAFYKYTHTQSRNVKFLQPKGMRSRNDQTIHSALRVMPICSSVQKMGEEGGKEVGAGPGKRE